MKVLLIILLGVVVIGVGGLLVFSDSTQISVNPAIKTVGIATPVKVHLANPHGVRRIAAYLEQNGARYQVFEKTAPSHWLFWSRHVAPETIAFNAGKDKAAALKEGKAQFIVEAVSNDFRGATTRLASDVDVILAAPRVIADDLQHYINQAGMELVTFRASGSWTEAGVRVGPHTFRSFPLPGNDPNHRFSMFAYAWDLPPDVTPVVYVRNGAGTEATARFWLKLFPKKFRERDFVLTNALMEKLVNNIDPTNTLAPGSSLLARFLKINGEMRRKNNQQLADLRSKTEEKVLWNGAFIHWGKEEASFADVRDYIYNGKKVDRQVHLGFDLSDVVGAPVHAANEGRVVWADNLGIYGNCVVLDHGYGLQSIYGHMSRIDVKPGEMVKKNGSLGIAGSTGLAEGVHVHFGMQIDGVQINPREWWDEHWIHDRILSKLQAGQ
ncbi:MAG: M23 family metallopeptidase [Acidobacteriia bacterium]|nr:M23 family metallopeptidase [Terriglobia bacterium]